MLRRHRLLVGLLGAFVLLAQAPSAAAAEPEEMEWTVVDRFGGDPGGAGRVEDGDPLTPAAPGAFAVRVVPSVAVCEGLGQARWRVDRKRVQPTLQTGESCSALVSVRGEGKHRVVVRVGRRAEVAPVEIRDELVVVLGDSVASGEGNPQGRSKWLDRPCHRSAAAGFEVAARRLAELDPHRSITFVSLACSGAEIGKGLLEGYGGVAPPRKGFEYPPQLERLRQIAAARAGDEGGGGGVDAVLLSVGANDLAFSGVVRECAVSPGDCSKAGEERLRRSLEGLGARYDKLGQELDSAVPGADIFVNEYFDPTHGSDGDFCSGSVFFTGRSESQWAYERLLRPLNQEIEAAAARSGWREVDGIAAAFERHGVCAKDRWVRGFGESLLSQGDWLGTLHPNEEGHRRIARRVAAEIAVPLGFAPPPEPVELEDEGDRWTSADWIATGVAAVVPQAVAVASLADPKLAFTWRDALALWLALPLLIALLWLVGRALLILRATWPEDPAPKRQRPRYAPHGRHRPLTIRYLVLLTLGAIALIAALVVIAGLAGRAILWLRFWSARLPADQAVSQVAGDELVSTGAVALAIFVGLGLVAVAIAWLLDGNGQEVRATRRGLVAIGLAEVLAMLWIGDFRTDQAWQILVGLIAAAVMLHYLVEQALGWWRNRPKEAPGRSVGEEVWTKVKARTLLLIHRPGRVERLWKLLPFLLLALAFYFSFRADGFDRKLEVLLPYLLAAILFAAPGGLAAPGVSWRNFRPEALRIPRIALALTGIGIVAVLLFRDERWLAAVAVTAVVLGLLCLAVAAASQNRFAPYGLAVLVSVPLFAAAAAFIHGLDSPQLQPVAVVLDDGEAVCGAYVGESDDRLWLGSLVLDERAGAHRPLRGAIASLEADRVMAKALGPLEPVDLLEPRALELRNRLLDERGDKDEAKRSPSCDPPPLPTPVAEDWQYDLAEKFQPELVMDRKDGFWPVPVRTLFSMRDHRSAICRRVAGGGEGCLRLGTPGEFPWIGGEGEWLEYPAANEDIGEQHDQMVAALGTADPEASATEYFLVHGTPGAGEPVSIQYWFFYPFNYQPAGETLAPGGYHEGDFEAIGVLLSASGKPRYVWMNRHDKEGRAFPWSDEALALEGSHPRVFAARGSHATYENCERQRRPLQFEGLIDDRPACDVQRRLQLVPEVTPLINLSRVGWACWQGLFGHRKGKRGAYERLPSLINDAPRSPLWQQKFGGDTEEPCRGRADPGGRDGLGEEVVEDQSGVPQKLREGASPLEQTIDECDDWETPATSGVYMVACDQAALTEYVESGLEDSGPAGLRIETKLFDDLGRGPPAVPAVRRSRNRVHLDDWRITAAQATEISVYATCPSGDAVVGARFENVPIGSGGALTLRDAGPEGAWLLVRPDGSPAARALPFRTRVKDGLLVERAPVAGEALPCRR
jgi:lysophospholipase L1-like esterase